MGQAYSAGGPGLLKFILGLYFGGSGPWLILSSVLYMAGLWKLFEKSGVKGWWALIPCASDYQLARCAGREPEGRTLSVAIFVTRILDAVDFFAPGMGTNAGAMDFMAVMLVIVTLMVSMVSLIYSIRVLAGLCRMYGQRRWWMLFMLLPYMEWIPALVWGFGKKYQPRLKVSEMYAELEKLAFQGSAAVMEEGLTVNLTERTAREFFQKKTLLRDIHMSIPSGHMVLLLGGSGAGKTTFLNAVNGYEKADAEVLLNGRNMYTQYKKMQYEVGFVPQQEMMRGKDTVLNTLLDAARLRLPRDVSAALRRKRVDEVMEIFGLTPVKDNLVEKLSGGQKKRLSISIEFISNPSLFILDEPDSGLDGVMARELFEQLRKIADTGKIVIVITHTPDRVIDLFDDVIVLAKDSSRTGRLAWYGSIEEARKFFGRDKMEQIVKSVNRKEEGGDGLADEFVMKYAEVQHG